MGFKFPYELKTFYEEIGYGFVRPKNSVREESNRMMDPYSVAEFRLRQGMWAAAPGSGLDKTYKDYEDNGLLAFLNISDSSMFMIEMNEKEKNPIYYYGAKVADSLKEFLEKYIENDEYVHDVYQEYMKETGLDKRLEKLLKLRGIEE